MITTKEELLALKPETTLLIPTTDSIPAREIDFSQDVHFLTLEMPNEKIRYAVLLSGDKEVSLFKGLNLCREKLTYKRVKVKDLLPVLMVNRLALLVDPFGDTLITLTPAEMCDYCMNHQGEIFTDDLNNIWYLNLRISQAKKQGRDVKIQLLHDLAEKDSFWVVSNSIKPISPFVSTIGKMDQRLHIMVFTNLKLAQQFAEHIRQGRKMNFLPVQISTKDIVRMINENPKTNINQFYLNDGSEAMAFSYEELITATRK